jgi:hypothetical protein
MKKLIVLLVMAALSIPAYATELVIGNWESSNDTWTSNGVLTPGKTVGVTLNSHSAEVNLANWGTALKYQFGLPSAKAQFMQNTTFEIDFSVASSWSYDPNISAGYTHLQKVIMNNATAGYTQVSSPTPAITYYWWANDGGSPQRTTRLIVDYTAYRDLITDIADDGTGSGYIEIIIETQTGGGAPPLMYFDRAILTPEPTTIALLGLGFALLRRKRS